MALPANAPVAEHYQRHLVTMMQMARPGRRPDASAGSDRRGPASRLPADGRLLWV